ncbi:MAG: hypothetical protein ACI9S8_002213 [Chlamydiales bacterium]|jgi:hypothetical protein
MRVIAILMSILLLTASCTSHTRYVDTSAGKNIKSSHPVKNVLDAYSYYLQDNEIYSMGSGVTEDRRGGIISFYQVGVIKKKLDMKEARTLMVQSVQELVKRINENKRLKKRLAFNQVTPSNIHFSLIVTDEKGSHIEDGKHVTKIGLRDGMIKYYKFDSDAKVVHETYEPAQLKSRYYSDGTEGKKREDNLVLLEQEMFSAALAIYEKPKVALWAKERLEALQKKMAEAQVKSDVLLKKSPNIELTEIAAPQSIEGLELSEDLRMIVEEEELSSQKETGKVEVEGVPSLSEKQADEKEVSSEEHVEKQKEQ